MEVSGWARQTGNRYDELLSAVFRLRSGVGWGVYYCLHRDFLQLQSDRALQTS